MGKTRGVHETTPELRNRMVGMYEAGLGLREIAAAVNCSQRTVKRWLNRFDKEGTVETRERCGRKRATTVEQDEAIIKLATQTPITAAKAVLPALGLSCSVDTIRERLHKAGIHNWSPSKKHIQRIPLGDTDGAAIQQAVWRPTGTQLGKKKTLKPEDRPKKTGAIIKKKVPPKKLKVKEVFIEDSPPIDSSKSEELNELPEYSYNLQNLPQAQQVAELPPPPPQPLLNQPEFGNSMNLVLPPHQIYTQDASAMTVNQSWPLVLGQSVHQFTPAEIDPLAHDEPPPPPHLQELHTQREQEQQVTEHQNRQSIHHQRHPDLVNHEKSNVTRTRVQSSSSNSYSNDNSSDNEQSTDGDKDDQAPRKTKRKTKKGGKAKGTLETSVEIRNRMIGMAEAGLTTLSIALAINRSERTVKRWLERWHKEGNVQTKERKGRRRITTKEQDDAIIAMATQHPLTAAKHVAPALGLNCSVDTIRERLHKAGIHSWKLGKKQGEGNAVHTVHLWQPSGNRPNKPKAPADKRKKSTAAQKLSEPTKRTARKKKSEAPLKNIPPEGGLMAEPSAMQYHEIPSYQPAPAMMQPVHIPATHLISNPGIAPPGPQPMQPIGPMMQPRPDCRLATAIPGQGNNPLAYSSCMVGSGHMEQNDPLNYEPFIWTF